MVITVSVAHLFKQPVELVYKCYNQRYINAKSNNIEAVENVNTKKDGDMEVTSRILTFKNFFPSIFQRIELLKTKEVKMEEECWSEADNRRYWIRSRNITWQDDATIAHSAFLSPDSSTDIQWTKWEQESFVDFSSLGKLGTILELYMKRHIEQSMKSQFKMMQQTMSQPE